MKLLPFVLAALTLIAAPSDAAMSCRPAVAAGRDIEVCQGNTTEVDQACRNRAWHSPGYVEQKRGYIVDDPANFISRYYIARIPACWRGQVGRIFLNRRATAMCWMHEFCHAEGRTDCHDGQYPCEGELE